MHVCLNRSLFFDPLLSFCTLHLLLSLLEQLTLYLEQFRSQHQLHSLLVLNRRISNANHGSGGLSAKESNGCCFISIQHAYWSRLRIVKKEEIESCRICHAWIYWPMDKAMRLLDKLGSIRR